MSRRPDTDEQRIERSLQSQEMRERRIALHYTQDEANKRDHRSASTARVAVVGLEPARAKHGSCRGVLGPLPVAGPGMQFECCDCHEVVDVSAMEASV